MRTAICSSPANSAHQQKPGHIRTGNQQHDGNGEKQRAKERAGLFYCFFIERPDYRSDAEPGHKRRVVAHGLLSDVLRIARLPEWA